MGIMQIGNLVNVYAPTTTAARPSAGVALGPAAKSSSAGVAPGAASRPSAAVAPGAAVKPLIGDTASFNGVSPQEPQPSGQVGVGIFVTRQSLVTFPAASGAVVVIWKVLGNVFPELGASKLVPLIASFVLGILIYAISEKNEVTLGDKVAGFAIAIVNSFWLAASAMGIDRVI